MLGILTMGFFVSVSVAGFYLTRGLVHRIVDGSPKHNDIASFYVAGVGVLYGLMLGLIAVGTWSNFSDADSKASREADSLGALYRDLDGYPAGLRAESEGLVRDYINAVIQKEWPAHRQGKVLDDGDQILEDLENKIMSFEPFNETLKISHAEAIKSLNEVVKNRGFRIQSVSTALPAVLWWVVILGAIINIGMTYLFWVENKRLHVVLIAAFSCCLGMLIFLTAAMDNPYRGEFSVSPDAYQYVLDHVVSPPK
jgi:hypothetical protein